MELGPLSPPKTWKEESGPGTWILRNLDSVELRPLKTPSNLERREGPSGWNFDSAVLAPLSPPQTLKEENTVALALELGLSRTWTTEPPSNFERGEHCGPGMSTQQNLDQFAPLKLGPLRLSLTQPEIWKLEEKSGTGIWTQWNLDH